METINFQSPPSVDELHTAVDELEKRNDNDYHIPKFEVRFREPVSFPTGCRKSVKNVRKLALKFFTATNGKLCYTTGKRTGLSVIHYFPLAKVESVSLPMLADVKADRRKKTQALAKCIHPNAWDNLKKELVEEPEKMMDKGLGKVNIKRKFPEYVHKALVEAFQNKSDYSYRMNSMSTNEHIGRDLSVQTKLCEDGIFRAWFSSEYPGCGNGGYYILLNPTTASFLEYD